MNFVNKIYELAEQIAYRHKMLNHHATWLLLSTIAVWSLSDNHPIPAIVAAILIMGFYAVIIMNDVKAKYGDKLIADGRKVSIEKAIKLLKTEILENCDKQEQQRLLDLLEKKCLTQIKFKNFFKYRLFWIAYIFWGWMLLDLLILIRFTYIK